MGDWYVGGTSMSRSSSASSLPDDHSIPFWTGKRPAEYEIFGHDGDDQFYPHAKRPKFHRRLNETVANIDQLSRTGFLVLRQDGQPYSHVDPGLPVLLKAAAGPSGYSSTSPPYEPREVEPHTRLGRPQTNLSQPLYYRGTTGNPSRYSRSSSFYGSYESEPRNRSPGTRDHTPNDLQTSFDGDPQLDTFGRGVMNDEQAADLVDKSLENHPRRYRDSRGKRILRSLISPKSPNPESEIDDEGLESIFLAANEIFFYGRLKGRVEWKWSDRESLLQDGVIGTTALRNAAPRIGGYEALIVLSVHFLKEARYSRRLLISTFLHEMIHCYLFISCGFKATDCGGHTKGFRRIAERIDDWVGRDILFLRNIEADLGDFLKIRNVAAPLQEEYQHHITHSHAGSQREFDMAGRCHEKSCFPHYHDELQRRPQHHHATSWPHYPQHMWP